MWKIDDTYSLEAEQLFRLHLGDQIKLLKMVSLHLKLTKNIWWPYWMRNYFPVFGPILSLTHHSVLRLIYDIFIWCAYHLQGYLMLINNHKRMIPLKLIFFEIFRVEVKKNDVIGCVTLSLKWWQYVLQAYHSKVNVTLINHHMSNPQSNQ